MPQHPIDEANANSIFGDLSAQQFYEKHEIKHREKFIVNQRGMRVFTQSWEPLHKTQVSGLVLVLHGFTGDSSWTVQLTAIGIAQLGFCVHALDHQGHGKSDGLRYHVPDINLLVDDCIQFSDLARKNLSPGLPSFIYSESMGGAIALLMHLRQPQAWDGLILNGALCGISEKFKPPWPLRHLLHLAAMIVPTWPIVPTQSIPAVSFKEPWKLELATRNPFRIRLRPRVSTAKELLRVATEVEARLGEVKVPFLIVHGEEDAINDPQGVIALYEKASSLDKTLRMYPGMWHQLVGEPRENLNLVFSDICEWLQARAQNPQQP